MTYKVQIDDEVRDATPEEVAIIENEKAELEQRKAEAQAKIDAKAVAEAKLAALGLDSDDLKALGL
jgi:copper oxidase (laccase) domain-containing protein